MSATACINCSTPLSEESRFCYKCGTPVPGHDVPSLTPQGREVFERLVEATGGQYEIVREIGRGGMAVVFLGYQKSLDREVAIKVLLPLLGYDPDLVQRFMREARTQGRLEHPYIISVYEVYDRGGLSFFAMPYVSGRSLRGYLKDEPRPPLPTVKRYLVQAAEALGYAHASGVIHRDVKPDNILINEERNCVVLTDFGIAKALSAATTLTTPGDLLGTPLYMSPEQGEGRKDIDGRADQYSLGLIGYEMLAGRPAYKAENLAELMYKHRFEDPEPLDRLRPDVPLEVRYAIKKAISKVTEERFADMTSFIAALEGRAPELAETTPVGRKATPSKPDEAPTVRIATPADLKSPAGKGVPRPARPAKKRRRRGVPAFLGIGAAAALATAGWFALGQPGLPFLPGAAAPENVEVFLDADADRAAVDVLGVDGPTDEPTDGATPAALPGPDDQITEAETGGGGEPERPAGDAGRRQPPEDPAIATARRDALAARDRLDEARGVLVAAVGSDAASTHFSDLDDRRSRAARNLRAGSWGPAGAALSALIPEYEERTRAVLAERERAARAGESALSAREAAVAAGAIESASDRLAQIDGERQRALALFDAGDFTMSADRLGSIEGRYRALSAELERAAVETETPGTPELPVVSPEEAIDQLVERFRAAFASEDLARMASEVYDGPVPPNDAGLMREIFDRAEALSATAEVRRIRFADDGRSANVDVRLNLRFELERTGETRTTRLDTRMRVVSGPQGWRLERLER